MDKSSVYLTRHGARIDTEDPSWLTKCLHNRADDPHLSSAGRTSALELARALSRSQKSGVCQLKHIVSSPYTRCVETAHIVADVVNLTVKIEPGIAEVNTTLDSGFLDACELREQFPLIDTSYTPVMTREDLSMEYSDGACAQRSAATALRVRENLAGSILFVGHGASCLGVAGAFGQKGYVGYASLTHFVQINGEWELDGVLGDVSHLSDKRTSLDSAW